ncbi:MAG: uroporphyrinogen-III synthase [Melioribacteraceae bacterium]|nr:uroporphyrinogen-III synthase [Melioribacteraceae bacterium]MCF8355889.1 uroporphyrinogen-III synthase [Melioribacteraceae bacterium]MCF8395202.1 uroporphyrinogen-III synthase [Melioribacteraceae bacterium]MCF8420676.1 uroporphyrinogen-III synthase [Melioribacteraceae bacterium]
MTGILNGKNIVVTKTKVELNNSFDELIHEGGNVICFPSITIAPEESYEKFDLLLNKLSHFDYVIFTSANTVKVFIERMNKVGSDVNFPQLKIIAIGKKTADVLREYDINPSLLPDNFSAAGISEMLGEMEITGKKFLLPGSNIMRSGLKNSIEDLGGYVHIISIYKTIETPREKLLREIEFITKNKIDVYAFTSPSTYRNIKSILNLENTSAVFNETVVCAIGEVTKAEIENDGIKVSVVPENSTLEDLSRSILKYYRN